MTSVQLIKQSNGSLAPANQVDLDILQPIKIGSLIEADIKQPRNPQFHRKFFAMLNFAFDYFEPKGGEWNGIQARKNFGRFRKDILILAGYHEVTYNIKGEVRVEAESISFGSMDETRFEKVYADCFNVCWDMVLSKVRGMKKEFAEQVVDEMLRFDG